MYHYSIGKAIIGTCGADEHVAVCGTCRSSGVQFQAWAYLDPFTGTTTVSDGEGPGAGRYCGVCSARGREDFDGDVPGPLRSEWLAAYAMAKRFPEPDIRSIDGEHDDVEDEDEDDELDDAIGAPTVPGNHTIDTASVYACDVPDQCAVVVIYENGIRVRVPFTTRDEIESRGPPGDHIVRIIGVRSRVRGVECIRFVWVDQARGLTGKLDPWKTFGLDEQLVVTLRGKVASDRETLGDACR